jgi:two-component system LytT family response regulator
MKLHGRPAEVAQQLATAKEIAEASSGQAPVGHVVRRIVAKSGDEYLLLNAEEVFAFEADGDLVWIITTKKRYLATQSLKVIQDKLRNTNFRRIHRNALVNIDHVRKMSSLSSQRWLLTLANGQEFVVSKRQAHTVRQLLSW